jgi:phospholipid/cholesterol/gamma-HCH transport system substrate-binding protein
MTRAGTAARAAATAALAGTLAGCQFMGLGTAPLPFTNGTGPGTYTVRAVLSDATNLPPNAEVMVHDVPVGTVTAIRLSGWNAELSISLPDSVRLPANATVTLGQKSIMGAEYVALAAPARPAGRLAAGAVIPLARTTTYPSTESVLAALSAVLNGGGLNQLATITSELNQTLAGHAGQIRDLLANLNVLAGKLDAQRITITSALSNLSALMATVRSQDATLAGALRTVPGGVAVLARDEKRIAAALRAASGLSTVADRVINGSRQNLLANLRALQPAVARLADSGQNLIASLNVLPTFPFPADEVVRDVRGDYANMYLTINLTLPGLEKAWLAGPSSAQAASSGNPLTAPLKLPSRPARKGPGAGSPPGAPVGSGLSGILNGLTGGGSQ